MTKECTNCCDGLIDELDKRGLKQHDIEQKTIKRVLVILEKNKRRDTGFISSRKEADIVNIGLDYVSNKIKEEFEVKE